MCGRHSAGTIGGPWEEGGPSQTPLPDHPPFRPPPLPPFYYIPGQPHSVQSGRHLPPVGPCVRASCCESRGDCGLSLVGAVPPSGALEAIDPTSVGLSDYVSFVALPCSGSRARGGGGRKFHRMLLHFVCSWAQGGPNGKKKCPVTQFSQKSPRAHHVLAVGGWRLAVGGGWWRLMAVGGGWWLGIGG